MTREELLDKAHVEMNKLRKLHMSLNLFDNEKVNYELEAFLDGFKNASIWIADQLESEKAK